MKEQTAKKMIDAFHEAKHILDQMPPLEEGLTPVCIHVIDVIHTMKTEGKKAYPSDIAAIMKTSRPGMTRTLKQLEKNGAVVKKAASDGRMVQIELTEKGERIYTKYIKEYYGELTKKLRHIDEKDIDQMVDTIFSVSQALEEKRDENE